jgi:hypothetical protein
VANRPWLIGPGARWVGFGGVPFDLGQDLLVGVQDDVGQRQDRRPGGGQPDAVGSAVEEPAAESAFEGLDALAQPGLGAAQQRRGG